MPSLHKLNPAEIGALEQRPLGARAQIAQEYDAYLANFALGDYGRAELAAGERRAVVRRRRALCFRSGPGPLIFCVAAAPVISSTPPQEAVEAAVAAPVVDRRSQRRPLPPRRRQTAERYHDMLPRWMREDSQGRATDAN